MHFNYSKSGMGLLEYKSVLDEEDAFDKVILDLAGKGVLKVGVVRLHGGRWRVFRRIHDYFFSFSDS